MGMSRYPVMLLEASDLLQEKLLVTFNLSIFPSSKSAIRLLAPCKMYQNKWKTPRVLKFSLWRPFEDNIQANGGVKRFAKRVFLVVCANM